MNFPVEIDLGDWTMSAHNLCEVLAYTLSFRWYLWQRTPTHKGQSLFILMGAMIGAMVGAKFLAWLEDPHWIHRLSEIPNIGKTIVGGILGAWLGIELSKFFLNSKRSTGDEIVQPLILAIAIGRIGCFLEGLQDGTQGTPSHLPWAIDFGDGIPRHPCSLYECFFLIILLIAMSFYLKIKTKAKWPQGSGFLIFAVLYFTWRFGIDFIKPWPLPLGPWSILQWASLLGVIIAAIRLKIIFQRNRLDSEP